MKLISTQKPTCKCVSIIVWNRQKLEAVKLSFNKWMDKQTLWCKYWMTKTKELPNHKDMKETYMHMTMWKKTQKTLKRLHTVIPITYMEFYQRQNCRNSEKISSCKELREMECHEQGNHRGYLGQWNNCFILQYLLYTFLFRFYFKSFYFIYGYYKTLAPFPVLHNTSL